MYVHTYQHTPVYIRKYISIYTYIIIYTYKYTKLVSNALHVMH